jgi:predicted Fe-S protein YdhL (DUF1289 family)
MDELDALAPSPCVKVCALDATKSWCTGCHRTLDEIAGWRTMTLTERLAVLHGVKTRRQARVNTAPNARDMPPRAATGAPHAR